MSYAVTFQFIVIVHLSCLKVLFVSLVHWSCSLVLFIGIVFTQHALDRYKNIDSKMVEMVKNEIMDQGDPVQWDDIAGLTFAKKTVTKFLSAYH